MISGIKCFFFSNFYFKEESLHRIIGSINLFLPLFTDNNDIQVSIQVGIKGFPVVIRYISIP